MVGTLSSVLKGTEEHGADRTPFEPIQKEGLIGVALMMTCPSVCFYLD